MFSAAFTAVAVAAAQDLFEIVAHATSRVKLKEIRIGQYSDAGDAAAEMLSVQVIRGFTTSGSGGSAVTPRNLEPWSRAAVSVVEANNTTVAQDGTGSVLVADSFNVANGWWWKPEADEEIYIDNTSPDNRLVVRITAPADSLTMNGTVVFEEYGVVPGV
jgi:hypothetical protein